MELSYHFSKRGIFNVKKSITFFALPTFILFLLTIFLSTSLYAQLAETPWPMFRHDLQHTGRSPYGSIQNLSLNGRSKHKDLFLPLLPLVKMAQSTSAQRQKSSTLSLEKASLSGLLKQKGEVESSPAIRKDGTILFWIVG